MNTLASADADLERDARALYAALSELIRVYQFRDRDRICCYDLSVSQCHALEALAQHGPLTLNELAGRLYLDKSTASRVTNALERKGLACRVAHPDDGRAVHLTATDNGRQRHASIIRSIVDGERKILADFPPEVRRAMVELVGRLGRAAAQRVDTTGGTCCCIE